jgi:hypothetical protein
MDQSRLNERLKHFLSKPEVKVCAIKGPWGAGKTYQWDQFLLSHDNLPFRAYSYVSLFGIKSIDSLRSKVFASSEFYGKSNSDGFNAPGLRDTIWGFISRSKIPYLGSLESASKIIEERVVKNYLICFDDIERLDRDLGASALLGFISELKEQKKCKVLLIYNDERLESNIAKVIDEYREKVIDVEVRYTPSIDYNLNIAWESDNVPVHIAEVFHKLDLNNIRVMRKVKDAVEYFDSWISDTSHPALKKRFEGNIAKLVCLSASFFNWEDMKFIMSTGYGMLFCAKDDGDKATLKERYKPVELVSYHRADFDQIIIDFIKNGFVEQHHYRELLDNLTAVERRDEVGNRYREVFSGLHHGFTTTHTEFVKNITTFVRDNKDELSIADIQSCVWILEKLGEDSSEFEEILLRKAREYAAGVERLEIYDIAPSGLPANVVQVMQEAFAEKEMKTPLAVALESLTRSGGWNPSELIRLANFTSEQYYDWIITESKLDPCRIIETFRERFSADKENGGADIWKRMDEALGRISEISELNKVKVERIRN